MRILVASETHFVRGPDGIVYSRFGVDAYAFWTRYLEAFDQVLVTARTGTASCVRGLEPAGGPNVEIAPLPDYYGPRSYLRHRHALYRAMRAAAAHTDAMLLRAPGPIAACAWRLRDGRPFAVEVVGDPQDALARGAVRGLVRPLARAVVIRNLRALCRDAVAVAYVSETTLPHRYPTSGWSTTYSSLDLDDAAFTSDADLARRAAARAHPDKGTARAPWRLLCVGSMAQPYKGQDVLIDALARCRSRGLEARLTLAGDGRCRAELEGRTRRRGLVETVRFVGHVNAGEGVRSLLDASDLFVLPSRAEGLPRVLIEAMARGVPAIGSYVGGVPELLPPDRLVPPGDVEALAAAIARLCRVDGDLLALAARDRATAERFAARRLRPRRAALYQRLHDAVDAHRARTTAPHPARRVAS